MKIISTILGGGKFGAPLLGLALLFAGNFSARAQSSTIPGDQDYEKFSAFISARNIFDPARYPHYTPHHTSHTQHHSNSAPTFALVGTMSYEKGVFAFFSGNTDDLKKVLPVAGNIVGYTVTEITRDEVKMAGPDKKEIVLKIGDRMQQGNSGWQLLQASDDSGSWDAGASAAPSSGGAPATSSADPTTAPPPNLGNNSVLERLRQLKEQENK